MNKDNHNIANNYFTLLTEAKKISDKKLDDFAMNPDKAVEYARNTLKKEWDKIPDLPKDKVQKIIDAISKSPTAASQYAVRVMKRRWPEAEPIIATDGQSAAEYVLRWDKKRDWTGERWVDLENIDPEVAKKAEYNIIIDTDNVMLPAYISLFTNRWLEFEDIVFTDRKNEIIGNDPEDMKQDYINHLKQIDHPEDED